MTDNMTLETIAMDEIHYDEDFNCRGKIAPIDVVDLAKDISQQGLIQPITITEYSEEKRLATGKKYLLIAGYRRYMAFKINGENAIPAVIRDDITGESEARFFNLSENLHRKNLNILQESRAISKFEELGIGEYEVAERLGMSRGWVQVRFMVLRLPDEVQLEIGAGLLNQTQIRDAYSHFKSGGKEACFDVVKQFKEDKLKGRVGTRKKLKKDKEKDLQKKVRRLRPEIFEMQDHISQQLGNSVVTRTLAWCAGEISTLEYHGALREWANNDLERIYRMPE